MGRSKPSGEIQTCRHSSLANHRQSIISILDGISATHSYVFHHSGRNQKVCCRRRRTSTRIREIRGLKLSWLQRIPKAVDSHWSRGTLSCMKSKTKIPSHFGAWRWAGDITNALLLAMAVSLASTTGLRAADDAAAQKLLTEARAKEAHAEELRSVAAAAVQKAADDQMEAGAEERDARILTAQALKLMGADANKQKAFRQRQQARKLWVEDRNMLIAARNDEQKAAQLTHNAEELEKSAAQLKDQPAVAAALESEAKEATNEAQAAQQAAGQAKFGAQSLDERAKTAWAEAEKLDPETHRQVAPATPKPVLAQPHQVR